MTSPILSIVRQLLHTILPTVCLICKKRLHQTLALCEPCYQHLPKNKHGCLRCAIPIPDRSGHSVCGRCLTQPPSFMRVFALLAYQEPVHRIIHQLKFGNQLYIAKTLGLKMAEHLPEIYHSQPLPEAIIPVPLHPKRLQQRGYNQALEIAKPIAEHLRIPLLRHVCLRLRHTDPQATLKVKSRERNVHNAFSVTHSLPETLAVVDDVVTTGATVNELTCALLRAGAKRVDVWCAARSGNI